MKTYLHVPVYVEIFNLYVQELNDERKVFCWELQKRKKWPGGPNGSSFSYLRIMDTM